jgi:hypothetical protein
VRREAEGGRRKAEGRRRKAEGGRHEAEGGRREAEGRRQKAEGRRQKACNLCASVSLRENTSTYLTFKNTNQGGDCHEKNCF